MWVLQDHFLKDLGEISFCRRKNSVKLIHLISSQGVAGPDCSQGTQESCWMVIPSWRTVFNIPSSGLFPLNPLWFPCGWSQVGESCGRIPAAKGVADKTSQNSFRVDGFNFCSSISQPPAPPGCQNPALTALVPLLCPAAGLSL